MSVLLRKTISTASIVGALKPDGSAKDKSITGKKHAHASYRYQSGINPHASALSLCTPAGPLEHKRSDTASRGEHCELMDHAVETGILLLSLIDRGIALVRTLGQYQTACKVLL